MKSVNAPPIKRQRLDHSIHEEGDDIEEIPGDEEEGEAYYDYEEDFEPGWDGASSDTTSPMTTAPQPPTTARGPQLMGLLCPHCRAMCNSVPALKEHISMCTRNSQVKEMCNIFSFIKFFLK